MRKENEEALEQEPTIIYNAGVLAVNINPGPPDSLYRYDILNKYY